MMGIESPVKTKAVLPAIYRTRLGRAYCADCLDALRSIPSSTIDLVLTSPLSRYGGRNRTGMFLRKSTLPGSCPTQMKSRECSSQAAALSSTLASRGTRESQHALSTTLNSSPVDDDREGASQGCNQSHMVAVENSKAKCFQPARFEALYEEYGDLAKEATMRDARDRSAPRKNPVSGVNCRLSRIALETKRIPVKRIRGRASA